MKTTTKRMLAALLAVMMAVTTFTAVSAFAAETDNQSAAADGVLTENSQSVAADEELPDGILNAASQFEGKVTGLGKTTIESNKIGLKWNKTQGATGYSVYICDADQKTVYTKVCDVTQNSVVVNNLRQASMYYLKVAAYAEKSGKRQYGPTTKLVTATQPEKPTSLLRTRSSDVVEIKWNVNNNATGYKIFRASADSGNDYVLVKTITGKNNNRYTEQNVKLGKIFTYKVVAFRKLSNGNMYHSPGATITCLAGLCAPGFSISTKLYKVTVNWNKNAYATRYDIYYSTNQNATAYTFAGSSTGSTFTTNRLSANQKLYFRVYPIYKANGRTITGTANTKAITVSDAIYGVSTGSTYVEISISQQRMWFYKSGKLLVDTPVVTGMRNSMDTPKGYFDIYSRARDTYLTGPGYSSHVDYWMAFSGGCGIHDASWRSSFGGSIYTYDGSHGCVNTPYNAVKTIYNNTGYGTPVIVY